MIETMLHTQQVYISNTDRGMYCKGTYKTMYYVTITNQHLVILVRIHVYMKAKCFLVHAVKA
jgi:hypothetical protein